ncbi:hypothetical protein GW17_00040222 [Ensete ventricosum]|nr:hypothetical protein GW17_00040222 [Ensete ventricosum]RZS00984.1 hypothetical protein BHM03_00030783 [Ensete ventricosum]
MRRCGCGVSICSLFGHQCGADSATRRTTEWHRFRRLVVVQNVALFSCLGFILRQGGVAEAQRLMGLRKEASDDCLYITDKTYVSSCNECHNYSMMISPAG